MSSYAGSRRITRAAADLHRDFIRAIDAELAELEARGSTDEIRVGSGVRAGAGQDGYCYRFEVQNRAGGLRPGGLVGFQYATISAAGVVIARSATTVVVRLDQNLGPITSPGSLLVDNRWMLTKLRQRIQGLSSAYRFDFTAAGRALGAGCLDTIIPLPAASLPAHLGLNGDQLLAVNEAHRRPTLFVWGPAACGKSQTLLGCVVSLLTAGLRILFVAPTNLAADDLLERGSDLLNNTVEQEDGAILRLGPLESLTVRRPLVTAYHVREVVARRVGGSAGDDPETYRRELERAIAGARLVVATVHQTYLSSVLTESSFDVVVIDEASMVSPISLYTAAGLGGRTIIAGDFRQLPPIAVSPSPVVAAWLRRDAFEVAGIPDDVERGDIPPYMVMLREQYRMAHAICELVADAYGGRLTTAPSVFARATGPLGRHSVMYVDTAPEGSVAEVVRGGSRRNAVHVRLVSDLLSRLVESGRIRRRDLRNVFVITPFAAQAQSYHESLRERFGRVAPQTGTIHRTQGREADIVILDLVDAPNLPVSRFLAGRTYQSESGRLLTVAITRARQHLIVIADFEHLLHTDSVGAVTRKCLLHVASTGRHIAPQLTMSG